MSSSILQNPSDPDSTFRKKAGKEHRGYTLNIEETVGLNGSVVTDYSLGRNNYSDSQFLKDRLAELPKQKEQMILIADGAYSAVKTRL